MMSSAVCPVRLTRLRCGSGANSTCVETQLCGSVGQLVMCGDALWGLHSMRALCSLIRSRSPSRHHVGESRISLSRCLAALPERGLSKLLNAQEVRYHKDQSMPQDCARLLRPDRACACRHVSKQLRLLTCAMQFDPMVIVQEFYYRASVSWRT